MCFLVAAWGTLLCAQPLGAQTEAKVAESVKRWADEIDGAANPKALREAREGMTKAYAFYAGKGQGFAYAQEAWKALSGMLKDAGPAKQINLAMVLSKMPTTSAQPALDAMVAHPNTAVRSSGHQLLAISGNDSFPAELRAKPPAFETDPLNRERFLAIAVVMSGKPDLQPLGENRVREWNQSAAEAKGRWTGGKEFSLAAPAHPCLDAESLFQRVAWLAYLSRQEPETYGAQFAREWLMTAQYEDYCDRSIGNLWGMNMSPADTVRAKIMTKEWSDLRAFFARLRDLTQPDLERLLNDHQPEVSQGFVRAHFTLEARQCINFLANHTREETRPVLDALKTAKHPMLVTFANARLASIE